jgi:hypothetical protein
VDPGSTNTGLVCLRTEVVPRSIGVQRDTRWLGSARLHPSEGKELTRAESDATLARKFLAQIQEWQPPTGKLNVVLEEPYDGMDKWSGNARGTAFGTGRAYGLLLAAARLSPYVDRIYSYPVTNHKGVSGWMQAGGGPIPARELTISRMQALAKSLHVPDTLSIDELMALGVLNFHLTYYVA